MDEVNGQYKLSIEGRITRLETLVNEIKTNHLFHIEKKIDSLLTRGPTPNEWGDHLKRNEDHERRIRILEKYGWLAIGGLYAVNIVVGIVISIN